MYQYQEPTTVLKYLSGFLINVIKSNFHGFVLRLSEDCLTYREIGKHIHCAITSQKSCSADRLLQFA